MTDFLNPNLAGTIDRTTRQTLDGAEYLVRPQWLNRAPQFSPFQTPPVLEVSSFGEWHLSVLAADGTALLEGEAARNGVDVLAGKTIEGLPPGRLLAWDTTGQGRDPGRNDLDPGDGVRLAYVPVG